jgi:hypothetical protein
MAKYGSSSIVVAFDDSGGSPQTMTQYVTEINEVSVESLMEESHSFGDSWFEALPVGIRKMEPITLSGWFDDTSTTGPDAIFNAPAATVATSTRTLTITWGGTKTTSVECYIKKYTRQATRNQLTKYTVELQPTGTVTEA